MLRLDTIIKKLPTKTFKKGEIIFKPGEIPKNGYIPIVGIIGIYTIDHNGIERRVIAAREYELEPNKWLVSPNMPLDFCYRAYTDVIVAVIDRREFERLLMDNPEAMYEFLLVQTNRMQAAKYRIETLIQHRAVDKLLHLFRYLVMISALPTNKAGWVKTALPMKQSDVADALGITRETAAKDLSQLEKEGVIKFNNKGIYLINKKKLAERTRK